MKLLLVFAGFLSLFLGIIGIFLPVLPTTPFLLLASACFLRSSGKLHKWITGHPLFGRYIRGYEQFKAVTRKAKISAIILLWISIGFSIYIIPPVWVKILLFFIACGVSVHLLLLRTLTRDMIESLERRLP
jgi:uncharacterized membrane protein YbaN (DUF454 family)